eukprot:g47623.t1
MGNLCEKMQDIRRVLNESFSSVFTLEKENVGMEFKKRDCEELAQFDIGNGEVWEALSGFKTEIPALDEMHPRLLWEVNDLRKELESRNQSSKGLKSQLIARLTKQLKTEAEKEEQKESEKSEREDDDEDDKRSEDDKEEEERKRQEEVERQRRERRYILPDEPSIIVHPNWTAKGGKFDCSVMSLSVLLDYRLEDNKEHSFEVSLFAELFNEMLQRDFGYRIYKALVTVPEKDDKKEKDKKDRKEEKKESEKREKKEEKDEESIEPKTKRRKSGDEKDKKEERDGRKKEDKDKDDKNLRKRDDFKEDEEMEDGTNPDDYDPLDAEDAEDEDDEGKSTFDMWEQFRDLLIRVQDQRVPVRKKNKDGKVWDPWIMREVVNLVKKEKEAGDIEDSEISVGHANMLGHFDVENKVVLGLLKSIKVDKSPVPIGIYSRLLREAKVEIVGTLIKIFVSFVATGEVPVD